MSFHKHLKFEVYCEKLKFKVSDKNQNTTWVMHKKMFSMLSQKGIKVPIITFILIVKYTVTGLLFHFVIFYCCV